MNCPYYAVPQVVRLLLQMVAVLVALQISGALHDFGDVLAAVSGEVTSHDCDDNDSQDQCPAGCPNCHCSAQTSVVVPTPMNSNPVLTVRWVELPILTLFETAHRAPHLPGLFRPPRSLKA